MLTFAVSNDKSSDGGTGKPRGVHLYNLTDNLASATYVATIGDGYMVVKMLPIVYGY